MAPLIVISNVYCYTGALQCLNVCYYYSHGRYPDTPGEESVFFMQTLLHQAIFSHSASVLSFHCGFNKGVCFIYPLSGNQYVITHLI